MIEVFKPIPVPAGPRSLCSLVLRSGFRLSVCCSYINNVGRTPRETGLVLFYSVDLRRVTLKIYLWRIIPELSSAQRLAWEFRASIKVLGHLFLDIFNFYIKVLEVFVP